MASPPLFPPILLFIFLNQLLPISANLHKTNLLRSELLSLPTTTNTTAPPTVFFEVTKPISLPTTKPCSYLLLRHDFAFTYGQPPVYADYAPPSDCPSQKFDKIVLEWTATCQGRQFDRIFGVWLGGAELLRSCTAEPRASGIVWTVKKDITRYHSLLTKNQTLAVLLRNIVDKTYTGVYHVNVSIHFYPSQIDDDNPIPISGFGPEADLILPISRDPQMNNPFWFEIVNSTDSGVKEFEIPQNAYRAVLEVYVSFHENDEFWYGNVPNEYIAANNLTSVPGNGPFREVLVSLDGELVGAVWPFTVVYTGGINPLLWRPISAIGSFDLPTYDIEITPFLGKMLDGKSHKLGFSVTNALNVWYIDANLHLWLDHKSEKTAGKLTSYSSLPLVVSLVSDFKGLNGSFSTKVSRSISSTGWVKSSHGKITTKSNQSFNYSNSMLMGKDGDLQIVNQTIIFNDTVNAKLPSSEDHSIKSYKNFTFFLYSDYLDQGNGTNLSVANFTTGFNEKKSEVAGHGSSSSSLKNLQTGQGTMVVKNNLVVSGLGKTQQVFDYNGGEVCYFRNVSSFNYTVLYDKVRNSCEKKMKSGMGFRFAKLRPLPTRRAFLGSELLDHNKGV